MRRAAVIFVALVGALTACSSSAKSAEPATTTAAGTRATPSTQSVESTTRLAVRACSPAPGFGPGTTTHHLTIAGADREFLVRMPPLPTTGMRLVVDFHGANSNMVQQAIYSGFDPYADRFGFVVATPNGADSAIRQWGFLGNDDVSFAIALVRDLVQHACVDPARVYAVGFSSGAALTAALACRASGTFAGFGPVAADFYFPGPCGRAPPRPIIIFHGTADRAVPYFGGHVGTSTGLPVAAAETTAADWARHNRCKASPTRTRLRRQVVRLTWKGCTAPVVMYRIEGGGHTWPGAIPRPIDGLTTEQLSATYEMWQFFFGGA